MNISVKNPDLKLGQIYCARSRNVVLISLRYISHILLQGRHSHSFRPENITLRILCPLSTQEEIILLSAVVGIDNPAFGSTMSAVLFPFAGLGHGGYAVLSEIAVVGGHLHVLPHIPQRQQFIGALSPADLGSIIAHQNAAPQVAVLPDHIAAAGKYGPTLKHTVIAALLHACLQKLYTLSGLEQYGDPILLPALHLGIRRTALVIACPNIEGTPFFLQIISSGSPVQPGHHNVKPFLPMKHTHCLIDVVRDGQILLQQGHLFLYAGFLLLRIHGKSPQLLPRAFILKQG